MRDVGTQLSEYFDATSPPVSVSEVIGRHNAVRQTSAGNGDHRARPDRRAQPERIRKPPPLRPGGNGFWIALAAGVVIVVLIGIAARFFGDEDVVEQGDGAPTVTVEPGPTATAEAAPQLHPVIPTDMTEPITPGRTVATAGTPPPDIEGAVPGDDGAPPSPLGTVTSLPNDDRLDFLFEFCADGCWRDAHFMDPANPDVGSGPWVAGRPFHVRHGFVNEEREPLGPGFSVVLYSFPIDDMQEAGASANAETTRHTPDYVLRGEAERCGPTYKSLTGRVTCEWFVHDFPDGLPAGRWAIWAVWEAPCSAWIDYGLIEGCTDPDEIMSIFSSGVDSPFDAPDSGAPFFSEPNMAAMTATQIDEFFASLEERMHADEGMAFEGPPPPGPEAEIDASGAASTAGTPLPDLDGAIAGDDGAERLPLGAVTEPASPDRLNFLFEQCYEPQSCFRDAFFINPDDPTLVSAAWQGGRPFHVRHGFINEGDQPLGPEFDVVVYVYQWDDFSQRGTTYRYSSDYVLRGTTDQCGPTYRTQGGPLTCEWFVHEFTEGLPTGRHALWAFWEAPCWAWVDNGFADNCDDPDEVISLFASGVDSPWEPNEVIWEQRSR